MSLGLTCNDAGWRLQPVLRTQLCWARQSARWPLPPPEARHPSGVWRRGRDSPSDDLTPRRTEKTKDPRGTGHGPAGVFFVSGVYSVEVLRSNFFQVGEPTRFIRRTSPPDSNCWISELATAVFASWRNGWDSNPREACTPNSFQDCRIRPLCHHSVFNPTSQPWSLRTRGDLKQLLAVLVGLAEASTNVLVKDHLAKTNGLRGDFDALVVSNELKSLFERQQGRRRQALKVIGS